KGATCLPEQVGQNDAMNSSHCLRMVRAATAAIAVLAVIGVFWGSSLAQRPSAKRPGARSQRKGEAGDMVKVKVFDRAGELKGPVETEKLVLTDAEWKKRLTAEQFKILRSSGTERPFCGVLLDNK